MPWKFTSKELDAETGYYSFTHRTYDPRTAGWISVDPFLSKYLPDDEPDNDDEHDYYWYFQNDKTVKLPGGGGIYNSANLNLYHYAGNNPLKFIDPDGRARMSIDPSLDGRMLGGGGKIPTGPNGGYIRPGNFSGNMSKMSPANSGARFVYDSSSGRYRDLSTGRFVAQRNLPYPQNSGFSSFTIGTVNRGTIIDRFGSLRGFTAGQPGASVSARGMPPGSENLTYTRLQVVRPIENVQMGTAAPVPQFNATGGAAQYSFPKPIEYYIKEGFLRILPNGK